MSLKERLTEWMIEGAIRKDGFRRKIVLKKIAGKIIEWMEGNMEGKKWYQSRTILFNIVSAVVLVAGSFASPESASNPHIQQAAAAIVTVANIVLRFLTEKPIEGEKKP